MLADLRGERSSTHHSATPCIANDEAVINLASQYITCFPSSLSYLSNDLAICGDLVIKLLLQHSQCGCFRL